MAPYVAKRFGVIFSSGGAKKAAAFSMKHHETHIKKV